MNPIKMNVAVIIPYYKASSHIAKVIGKIPSLVNTIVIVDDASPDKLPVEELQSIKKADQELVILRNEVNLGVGGATKKGFLYALEKEIAIVVKIDADDQMDLNYLPEMLDLLVNNKAQMVKGNRFKFTKTLNKMPLVRRMGNLGISFLAKMATGYWNNFDPTNGYFALKTKILKDIDFQNLSNRYFFETSLLSELYFNEIKIKDVAMPPIYGDEKSNMKVWSMPFYFLLNLIKLFVKRIIKSYFLFDFNIGSVYLLFGSILFFFGIIFGGINWYNYAKINTQTPTGTIMIASLTLILGFQLLLQFLQYDIFKAPKALNDEK